MLQKAKDALNRINEKISMMQSDGYVDDMSEEIRMLEEYVKTNCEIRHPLFIYPIAYHGTNPPKGLESCCHKDYHGSYFCFVVQDEDGTIYVDNTKDAFDKCENPVFLKIEDDTVIATYFYVEELELMVAIPKTGSVLVDEQYPSGHEINVEYGKMRFATKDLKQFSLDNPNRVFNGLPICGTSNVLNWISEMKKMFPDQCVIVNRCGVKPVALKDVYRFNKYAFGEFDVAPAEDREQNELNKLLSDFELMPINLVVGPDDYVLRRTSIIERVNENLWVYRAIYIYADTQLETYRMYMGQKQTLQCEITNHGKYVYVERSRLNTTRARKALKDEIAKNELHVGERINIDSYICE